MGGVGSLQRVNRTLYVGRIHEEPRISGPAGRSNDPKEKPKGSLMKRKGDELSPTEKVLWRHFSEWGEIERSESDLPKPPCLNRSFDTFSPQYASCIIVAADS